MYALFAVIRQQLVLLFCFLIVFNVKILATNESQRSETNEVLNSSDIAVNTDFSDIIDNQFDSTDNESANESIQTQPNLLSIIPEVNEMLDLANDSLIDNNTETVHQLNATHELKVNCTPVHTNRSSMSANQTLEAETTSELILVNVSKLSEYLESQPNVSQTTGADCSLVIFYYKWCPFTAKYAKHFNALARVYPQFHVLAIDAYGLNSVNMRYGLVGVPTLLFFHNGKIVGKVNDSEPTIDGFVAYIKQLTGLSPVMSTNITESDLLGPLLATIEPKFDYLLLFSWIFCIICFSYLLSKSNVFKTTIETVRNTWREAEAQHEHMD